MTAWRLALVTIFCVLALLPVTAFAEEEAETQGADQSTQQAIEEAKETTNQAIEAAKQAVLEAIDAAKEAASSVLESEEEAAKRALDKAKDATSTLDQASEAAREVLEKAKQATEEILDKAKGAAQSSSELAGKESSEATKDGREVPVTIDNFIRAATDIELQKYVSLAGGVNRFYHFREPTPIDNQPTIRMNRDTLYSTVVVDISEGATLTLPDAGDRYMSAMVVNQDHYINEVFHGGGSYKLDMETFDTPYVIVYVRTLVDASDADDVGAVNALQDQMTIEAASAKPFVAPDYDEESYQALVERLNALMPFFSDALGAFGAKKNVDPVKHLINTAVGWGGLPETEAFYGGADPGLPVGEYKIEVPAEVPVGAFWSVSLYNADGFFEPNDIDGYVVNSETGTRNNDGSMTVHLGGCDDGRVNCLPIMEGWNYVVRLYEPGPEILDGSWTFPKVQPAK